MTVKTFFYGLISSFAIPWLIILVVPFGTMRSIENVQYDEAKDGQTGRYSPIHSGRIATGSRLYAREGCTMCHTQVTRPSYAGNDVYREGLGGFAKDADRGDTRRITNPWDFNGEDVANIGEMRVGPDLGNYGRRIDALAIKTDNELAAELGVEVKDLGDKAFNKELHVLKHLYSPQTEHYKSNCQSNSAFFEKKDNYGQGAAVAVAVVDGKQVIPNDRGLMMASYLLNLKRDGAVPASMQYKRVAPTEAAEKK